MTQATSPTDALTMLKRAAEIVAPWSLGTAAPEPDRLDVEVDADGLLPSASALAAAGWGRLSAITGLDLMARAPAAGARGPSRPTQPVASPTDDLEVLYHFCASAALLTLRVRLSRAAPVVPSVQGVLVYAGFFERELHELFGVEITGAPSLDRLLLADDWPADVYPLRKDAVMPPPPTPRRAD